MGKKYMFYKEKSLVGLTQGVQNLKPIECQRGKKLNVFFSLGVFNKKT
jgi:hypothetical protein